MSGRRTFRWGFAALLAIAGGIAAVLAAGSARAASPSDIVYQVKPIVESTASTDTFTNPFCSGGRLVCYTPSDIRTAYGYPAGLDGSGQTIVIVDAFGSPTIRSDLATFDAKFGIPAPPSFTIDCTQGCPTFSPNAHGGNQIGWAEETSLDVEWAHAMAPGAKIVLMVASTNYGNAINAAEALAIQNYPGAIISQSFGSFESGIVGGGNNIQLQQAHQNYVAAAAAGDTVLASAGDWGATNLGTTENAVYPASDPLVTAIGGTQGDPYYNALAGAPLPTCALNVPCTVGLATVECSTATTCPTIGYGGEEVWNEPVFGAATGGAESLIFSAPSYQVGVNGSARRTTPDVSYNAAVSGGVLVYLSIPGIPAGYYIFGGTSAGSPQMASVVALANQARGSNLGFLNTKLYSIAESGVYGSDFHDITVGDNKLTGTPFGYSAGSGYDIASGWGTPQVGSFVASLASS